MKLYMIRHGQQVETLGARLKSISFSAIYSSAFTRTLGNFEDGRLIQLFVCSVLGVEYANRSKLGPVHECSVTTIMSESGIFRLNSYNECSA